MPYKIFPKVELALWLLFLYGYSYNLVILNVFVVMTLLALYLLAPGFVLGARGWKTNLWAIGTGLLMAWGVQTVVFHKTLFWESLLPIPFLVFWPALIGAAVSMVQTFRAAAQRAFFGEVCVRLSIIALFTLPYVLGWWVPADF